MTRHRIPAGTKVERSWECPICLADEAFVTTVALGDYVHIDREDCPHCGFTLMEAEAQELSTKAMEAAPDDAIGEWEDR